MIRGTFILSILLTSYTGKQSKLALPYPLGILAPIFTIVVCTFSVPLLSSCSL
ncbi:hypothetical protein SAMN02745181_3460 [Rubritalea squalenifaciens DSM 18772]|uniref:Uncharacterized protein n=1 Tax=Rubritalea squalenifaciens DSM 18772 TaxID=1123071 RepID=A0A1M6QPB9_9BACT|nr:hypothetical protein SAMN02745181_3460 [Rubritalea squalenifaciens DSM 18772]